MSRTVLIMAGGTGGHVFPALALARLLRERALDVVWLGTRRGLEARVVPADGFPIEWLSVGGLRGKGLVTKLLAPFTLLRAVLQSLAVLRRRRPAVVVGLGGFASGPGGIAAWLSGRPLVIHEQNAVAGYTNRVLARFAKVVLSGFPGAFPANVKARVIGNPVREDIAQLPPPAQRFAGREGPVRLLVVGGSLGAARLNAVVPEVLAQLARDADAPRLIVRHQAGEKHVQAAREAYANAGIDLSDKLAAEDTPFIADMCQALAWADLVVCRAGALTIAELAAAGLGAILVPYPHAVDDHQTRNAQLLVDAGAAHCIADAQLTPAVLIALLRELCADRTRLLAMAEAARREARPQAAVDLMHASLVAGGLQ
ncbi:MAG: undecaprenyldiphospho-muramoylpentapeptide beta-N-acetylglucosaminyltransferase [Nevskiaceae bacterium]|jgi:UDP-N-acetylglucosamine--N-acetylmuramyl-(pentapeptide) pyrophosphoryl-undecaprenol N-acetylglucosamine transferase|nr:undecaprenyldiphospho-muramoylpentapeptide beta-N-acetylglucosaminyltransferase [Nevskiaceae bacterium]